MDVSASGDTRRDAMTLERANAIVEGKWLLRSHGAYKVIPAGSVDEAALSGGAYIVKELSVVGLSALADTVAKLRERHLAEGLCVSSVEVIDHLRKGGVELMRVPRGTRRWAIVTTVMCTAKDNLVKEHDLFFFGEAHGPRTVVRERDQVEEEQPKRQQPEASEPPSR